MVRYICLSNWSCTHSSFSSSVEVEGYVIAKGATLITSMESLHKNPNIYPNPERFYPERFSHHLRTMQASANGKLEERDHFNFGWGR